MSKELIDRLKSYIPSGDGHNSQYANDLADAVELLEAADALEAKAAPVGEREAFEAHMRVGGYSNPDKHPDGSYVSSAMELWWQGWKARAAYQRAQQPQSAEAVAQCTNEDSWNCKYCRKTENCAALKDPRNFTTPQSAEPVEWRCRVAGSDHYVHFPTKRCRFCEPLYTTPQPSAGVVMPLIPYKPELSDADLTDYEKGRLQGRCDMWAEFARLNGKEVV